MNLLGKRDTYGQILHKYSNRLLDALKSVHTEYSVIAADDDFYFPNHFIKSLILFEKNRDYVFVLSYLKIYTL